jgi:hypothetical protein
MRVNKDRAKDDALAPRTHPLTPSAASAPSTRAIPPLSALQSSAGNAATAAFLSIQRAGGDLEREKAALERLRRANARALGRKDYDEEPSYGSKSSPFGPYTSRAGRGSAPFISSNKKNYPDSSDVGSKYYERKHSSLHSGLISELDSEHYSSVSKALRGHSLDKDDLGGMSSSQRRSSSMLYGIASEAEDRRFPGATKPFRSALDRQSDLNHEPDKFLDDFPMAKRGGAHYYDDVLSGRKRLSTPARETLLGMSDSSSDDDRRRSSSGRYGSSSKDYPGSPTSRYSSLLDDSSTSRYGSGGDSLTSSSSRYGSSSAYRTSTTSDRYGSSSDRYGSSSSRRDHFTDYLSPSTSSRYSSSRYDSSRDDEDEKPLSRFSRLYDSDSRNRSRSPRY